MTEKKKITIGTVLHRIICALILLYILAPIFVLAVASFSEEAVLTFPPKAFSLQWYRSFFGNKGLMTAFKNSILLAVSSAACALVLGSISAYAIDRSNRRDFFLSFFAMPLTIPTLITGLALLQMYSFMGLDRNYLVLLSGHIVITTPFVIRTVAASLYRFNVALEEAAQTLGANRIITFLRITLPILKPALISSACFAFIESFGNMSVSMFLTTARYTTLPILVFAYAEYSPEPTIAAISSVILVFTIAVMTIIEKNTGMEKVSG